ASWGLASGPAAPVRQPARRNHWARRWDRARRGPARARPHRPARPPPAAGAPRRSRKREQKRTRTLGLLDGGSGFGRRLRLGRVVVLVVGQLVLPLRATDLCLAA